jgi:hypothetical protein
MIAMRCTSTVRALAYALMAASLLLSGDGRSDRGHDEYDVKAAFIYNFAALVKWPPSAFPEPGGPITLAILGADDFAPHSEEFLADRTVDGRRIEVTRISTLEEIKTHHMVFVSASEDDRIPQILEAARGRQVLTIGESRVFTRSGGIISFYREGNKIRFEINRPAAEAAGLKISSRLLRLARLVSSDGD